MLRSVHVLLSKDNSAVLGLPPPLADCSLLELDNVDKL